MKTRLAAIRERVAKLLRRRDQRPQGGKRALVHEILSMQVLSAAVVGGLAIIGLYWGGQWILQDNYSRWALQWTEQLNELGSPLYLADDNESRISLNNFVDRYPEIDQVVYYAKNGSILHSVDNSEDIDPVNELSSTQLEDAIGAVGQKKPYVMRGGLLDPRQFDILAPVWIESIPDDGLFGFDATSDEPGKTELLGFVKMKLDFVMFHDRLLEHIRLAIAVLAALLILFALYGRHALRKALASISELQIPIQELAKGNLNVKFEPAQHREISDIVEALETTAAALSERDAQLMDLANHDSFSIGVASHPRKRKRS